MKFVKEWGKLCVTIALLLAALGVFVWHTSRPVVLDPAELTPTDTYEAYPGTSLSLDLGRGKIQSAVFANNSGTIFEHGDPPDRSGLEVLLNGRWYYVPHKSYSTAGVGKITEPGNTFTFEPIQTPYGKLPDGQYRLSLGYWEYTPEEDRTPLSQRPFYVSCARFDIVNGTYIPA